MPATNHCDKEKWFQNCMIKHTKQSCPHDGQIREPWKRDPDREPVISKINCEKVKKVLAVLGILLCASLCYIHDYMYNGLQYIIDSCAC